MEYKKSVFGIIGICTAMLLLFGSASAASSCQTWSTPNIRVTNVVWGNSTHPISAAPGNKDIPLTITLESYDTDCVLQNVVGTLNLYGGVTDFTGSQYSSQYLQSIQPPSMFNMVFHLNIGSNVTVGPNSYETYPLVLSWDSDNGSTNVQQQINVQVPLKGAANLTFTLPTPDVTAGKISNVTIIVSNTGTGAASDISTKLTPSSGVSLLTQPGMISYLAPGQSHNITAQVYIAPSQAGNSQAGSSTPLGLNTYYINPYGYNTSISASLGLFASSPSQSLVLVSVPNQTLISGKITRMNLTVTNSGSDPITNLSVVLTPVSPLSVIGSDNLEAVPAVGPGQSAKLPVTLFVESSTDAVSTLDISLSYILDNQQVSASRSISFLNPGNVNISVVSTVLSPATPVPGEIFSITSTIENTGFQTATAVSVSPRPPAGIRILGENSTFIGSIPIDTPTAMTVSFTASQSATPGKYTIPVVLSYLNNLNQPENETFYYYINVASPTAIGQSSSPGSSRSINATVARGSPGSGNVAYYRKSGSSGISMVTIVVGLAIIAGSAYYLYSRRRKSHTKDNTKAQHR